MERLRSLNFLKNILLVLGILLLSLFLYKIQSIVILFFASFVIASAFNPIIDLLSRKIPRKAALFLVILSGFIVITLICIPLLSILIKQFVLFLNHTPVYWAQIQSLVCSWLNFAKDLGLLPKGIESGNWIEVIKSNNILPNISQILSSLSGVGQNIVNGSIGLTKNFFAGIMFLFTSALIVTYMLMDKVSLKADYLRLFPENTRARAEEISAIISKKVGGFVIGQLILMLSMGLLVTVGLSIIRVDFALILGTIAGLLDIIPVVGPFIAVTLIVLIALAQKPILALWALLTYMLIQWIVDTFLRPFILGKFLDLHPLVLIFSLLSGAYLLGIVGIVLAPAVAAAISALVDELYIKRINPEKPAEKIEEINAEQAQPLDNPA